MDLICMQKYSISLMNFIYIIVEKEMLLNFLVMNSVDQCRCGLVEVIGTMAREWMYPGKIISVCVDE